MMASMSDAELIIGTLLEHDPEFAQLVETLYGDVSKASPDSNDSHVARNIAMAGTAAGAVMGTRDLITDTPKLVRAARGGKLIPAALGKPGRKVALAGTALGADVLATHELKKPARQPVDKLAAPSIADMATGIRTKMGGLTDVMRGGSKVKPTPPPGTTPLPKKPPVEDKRTTNARQFTQGALMMGGTPAGKVVMGGGLIASAVKAHQALGGGQPDPNQLAPDDPTLAKRRGSDIEWQGTFSKIDNDKQQVFGWASVVKMNGLPVTDHQEDLIEEADLEDAAYHYVLNSRVGGKMHKRIAGKDFYALDEPYHASDLIESMVFTDEKVRAMGLPDSFPRGWWTGFQIHDPETWHEVKIGKLRSFSIHGKGKREEIPVDSLMGW